MTYIRGNSAQIPFECPLCFGDVATDTDIRGVAHVQDGDIYCIEVQHAAIYASGRWHEGGQLLIWPPSDASSPLERAYWSIITHSVDLEHRHEIEATLPYYAHDERPYLQSEFI